MPPRAVRRTTSSYSGRGDVRRRGLVERRPPALPAVAGERELGDDEHRRRRRPAPIDSDDGWRRPDPRRREARGSWRRCSSRRRVRRPRSTPTNTSRPRSICPAVRSADGDGRRRNALGRPPSSVRLRLKRGHYDRKRLGRGSRRDPLGDGVRSATSGRPRFRRTRPAVRRRVQPRVEQVPRRDVAERLQHRLLHARDARARAPSAAASSRCRCRPRSPHAGQQQPMIGSSHSFAYARASSSPT